MCVFWRVVGLLVCLAFGVPVGRSAAQLPVGGREGWWLWRTDLALLHDRAEEKRWWEREWRLLRCKISSMCAASMVVVGARPITWLRSVWCFGASVLEGSRMRCRVCQGSCSWATTLLYESLPWVTKPLFGIWTHSITLSQFLARWFLGGSSLFCFIFPHVQMSRPCSCQFKSSPSHRHDVENRQLASAHAFKLKGLVPSTPMPPTS